MPGFRKKNFFILHLFLFFLFFLILIPVNLYAQEEINKPFPVSFTAQGRTINGYMVVPSHSKNAAIVWAQGYGARANECLDDLQVIASKGFVGLCIDYRDYYDLIYAVQYLEKHEYVDKTKIGMIGFSLGAESAIFVSEYIPLRAVVEISGACIVDGKYFPDENSSPLKYIKLVKCPIVIFHSKGDPKVSVENAYALEKALKAAGKKVKMEIFPYDTHWPGGNETLLKAIDYIKNPI
ncbi:MAG: dienelactone hydrolase family protein [Firmicutes bacterium]|nr:dienelactone hydrolase family protein [Bacillota bacterium]